MGNFEIIKLPLEKWQSYRNLRLEALTEEPQAFCSSYVDMARLPPEYWQGRLADAARGKNSWLMFAQDGEQLVGMIGAFYDKQDRCAQIVSLYVSKGARLRGVGEALLMNLLSEIGDKKAIRKIRLGVNQEQVAAIRLYHRFGFHVIGDQEEMHGDRQINHGFIMEKQVSQPEKG